MQLVLAHREHVAAFEEDFAAEPRRFEQPQQRERGHRLAGARFTDEGKPLAGVDVERNTVDDPP